MTEKDLNIKKSGRRKQKKSFSKPKMKFGNRVFVIIAIVTGLVAIGVASFVFYQQNNDQGEAKPVRDVIVKAIDTHYAETDLYPKDTEDLEKLFEQYDVKINDQENTSFTYKNTTTKEPIFDEKGKEVGFKEERGYILNVSVETFFNTSKSWAAGNGDQKSKIGDGHRKASSVISH